MPLEFKAQQRRRPQDGEWLTMAVAPIEIENPLTGQTRTEQARIDTGAESTVASCSTGRAIGLVFTGPPDIRIRTSLSHVADGYIRDVRLRLESVNAHEAEWRSRVVFVPGKLTDFMLGWAGGLNYFRLSIDLPRVVLEPREPGFPARHTCPQGTRDSSDTGT